MNELHLIPVKQRGLTDETSGRQALSAGVFAPETSRTIFVRKRHHRFTYEVFSADAKCSCHLEHKAQCWHVLATLNLPHVRALYSRLVGQLFLGDTGMQPRGSSLPVWVNHVIFNASMAAR